LAELDQLCGRALLRSARLRWLRHTWEAEVASAQPRLMEVHQSGVELSADTADTADTAVEICQVAPLQQVQQLIENTKPH